MIESPLQSSDHSEATSDVEAEIDSLDVQECIEVHSAPPPAPPDSATGAESTDKPEREKRYALRRNVAKPDRLGFGTALKQATANVLRRHESASRCALCVLCVNLFLDAAWNVTN